MTPVRLGKKSERTRFSDKIKLSDKFYFFCNSFKSRVVAWCIRHAPILLFLSIILCLLLFVVLCSALCGVSALESGNMRNFMNGGYL